MTHTDENPDTTCYHLHACADTLAGEECELLPAEGDRD